MEKYENHNSCYDDNDAAAILRRLEHIEPLIEEVREIFQAPSFSIGISYRGKTLWTKSFGHANHRTGLVPNSQTVYSIGSCTKGFTGTALSLLAERKIINLDQPVSSKISSLKTEGNPVVAKEMTIRDMLSHCAGLSAMPFEVLGRHGHVFAKHEDIVHIFNHLPRAAEFRSEWMYNNWLFALAGTLIVRESGTSYGNFVQREIFDKLGMKRTFTNVTPDANHAVPYLVFDDQSPEEVDLPQLDDGVAFDSSGAIGSCVDDLLLWSRVLMQAWRTEHPSRRNHLHDQTLQDPRCLSKISRTFSSLMRMFRRKSAVGVDKTLLKSMATAQTPQFPLAKDKKQQYALGLFNLHLPTTEMNVVTNPDVNDRHYSIGKDSGERRLVIGHTGELGGFLSAYWTFPEDDCSLVVLTNSFQINGDPTNIIAQLLAQTIFEMRPVIDFKEVANKVVHNAKGRWENVNQKWKESRLLNTSPQPLEAYVGKYENSGLAMSLSITLSGDDAYPLLMRVNDEESQVFDLYHYHTDSWTFLQPTRDECIKKGYAMYLLSWKSWIISFDLLEDGRFGKIKWSLDADERVESQVFLRK